MVKLRRRDVELLEAVDRAVAFDRTVDRARVYSPSLFPPEITCKKYILDDGACEHVFHHRTLGELGRIRIEDRSGSTHIGGLVTGDTETPLHAQRDALFRRLMEAFARAGNRRCFQDKHMSCERCGAIAASPIFMVSGDTNSDPLPPVLIPTPIMPSCYRLSTPLSGSFLVFTSVSRWVCSGSTFVNLDRINPLLRFSRSR